MLGVQVCLLLTPSTFCFETGPQYALLTALELARETGVLGLKGAEPHRHHKWLFFYKVLGLGERHGKFAIIELHTPNKPFLKFFFLRQNFTLVVLLTSN